MLTKKQRTGENMRIKVTKKTIWCDECQKANIEDSGDEFLWTGLNIKAVSEGWSIGERDLCPYCLIKLAKESLENMNQLSKKDKQMLLNAVPCPWFPFDGNVCPYTGNKCPSEACLGSWKRYSDNDNKENIREKNRLRWINKTNEAVEKALWENIKKL